MNADQVRALVAAKWPEAMQSPVARAFAGVAAQYEADRAIEFAGMQARASTKDARTMRDDATEYARECIESCEAIGVEYDEETLGHNIESNFPELSSDVCDGIAGRAIATFRGCKDR